MAGKDRYAGGKSLLLIATALVRPWTGRLTRAALLYEIVMRFNTDRYFF
jgi:hypothetical protein